MNFDPTLGTEIKKSRPAVVISSDSIGRLPLKVVVPLTKWRGVFAHNVWHVRVQASGENGLRKDSAADALQVRSVDTTRFVRKLGNISATELSEIVTAVAIVIEYQ